MVLLLGIATVMAGGVSRGPANAGMYHYLHRHHDGNHYLTAPRIPPDLELRVEKSADFIREVV